MDREWLAGRIEIEAWAHARADQITAQTRWGRVLGFLEVETHAGY